MEALGKGNDTEAVVAACEHAFRDVMAKKRSLKLLGDRVGEELLEEIAEVLSTPQLELEVDREVSVEVED